MKARAAIAKLILSQHQKPKNKDLLYQTAKMQICFSQNIQGEMVMVIMFQQINLS